MDTRWTLGVVGIALSLGLTNNVVARDVTARDQVEVELQAVFTPPKGWDDNDRVQAVIYGQLPGCFSVGETVVERTGEGSFLIRQFASREPDGPCTFVPVLFTKVADLGSLTAGAYDLVYKKAGSSMTFYPFEVTEATTTTVDSLPYANTLQQYSEDILDEGQNFKVKIKGVLSSTCWELDPDVKVQREGDVFIVLPLQRKRSGMCAQVILPFEHELDLGTLSPGNYLVHVRSQNGQAINHVVKVLRKTLIAERD